MLVPVRETSSEHHRHWCANAGEGDPIRPTPAPFLLVIARYRVNDLREATHDRRAYDMEGVSRGLQSGLSQQVENVYSHIHPYKQRWTESMRSKM